MAALECGWSLTGGRRAVLDLAVRRARIWVLPSSDFYGALFQSCVLRQSENSWAVKSIQILRRFSVPDLPELGMPFMSVTVYKQHVFEILRDQSLAEWKAACASHTVPLVYLDIHSSGAIQTQDLLSPDVSWSALRGHRSLCRLRMSTLDLAHRSGVRSVAKIRECIMCGKHIRSACLHCLGGDCDACADEGLDAEWGSLTMRDRTMRFLTCLPGDVLFNEVCAAAFKIDRACANFWHVSRHQLR